MDLKTDHAGYEGSKRGMSTEAWIPEELPTDKPNAARIYDYFLGGYHNFEADRIVAGRILTTFPDMRLRAYANRAFLRRAVNFLVGEGIDQFLDIGSGIPTIGNVHEVAQNANPASRIVYVDIDPVAVAHSRAILTDNPRATAIGGDIGQPEQILDHPEVRNLLDFNWPMAILLLTVLEYILDGNHAGRAVRILRDALVPGSYVAISHSSLDDCPRDILEPIAKYFTETATDAGERSYAEIRQFFDGLELVEPGLVRSPLWRPEGPNDVLLDRPERALAFAGIGRKPT